MNDRHSEGAFGGVSVATALVPAERGVDDVPLMAVVVVNFGSHKLIEAALGSLPWHELPCRVVIVDNYSTDLERAAIRDLTTEHEWSLVELPSNRGFGAGVNAGVAEAMRLGCVVFMTLNPDARVTADVLRELRAHSLREPLALICPMIRTPAGKVEFQGAQLSLTSGRMARIAGPDVHGHDSVRVDALPADEVGGERRGWLTGACLVLHRELWDRVGGFDESYFLYWEDVDLSFRCEDVGGSLVVRRDLVVVHDEGGTQGPRRGRAKSNTYYYYDCRNRLAFASRRLPRHRLLRWMLVTPTVSWEVLKRGGRRQLVQSPKPLVATVRGSLAGMCIALMALFRPRRPLTRVGGTPLGMIAPSSSQRRARAGEPILVTVAVLTFRRHDDIATALPLLVEQATSVMDATDSAYEIEILVVDNDAGASAAPVVDALGSTIVRYVVEPTPGISAARNRALEEAVKSDLLVFIDDDERPYPGWLRHLLDAKARTDAPGVAGAVVPEFECELDPWLAAGPFFVRRRHPTGTGIRVAATNNLLLDMAEVRRLGLSFDADFGLSGGEDTLFTRTLAGHGRPMVWCDEAVVTEWVPRSRMNRRWVLLRAFSSGNSHSRVSIVLTRSWRGRQAARAAAVGAGVPRSVGGLARYLVGVVVGSVTHQANGLRIAARGAGMVAAAFDHVYQEYRRD